MLQNILEALALLFASGEILANGINVEDRQAISNFCSIHQQRLNQALCCLTVNEPQTITGDASRDYTADKFCLQDGADIRERSICNFLNIIGNASNDTNSLVQSVNIEVNPQSIHGHRRRCSYDSLLHSQRSSIETYPMPSGWVEWSRLLCSEKTISSITTTNHDSPTLSIDTLKLGNLLKAGEFVKVFNLVDILEKLELSYSNWANADDSHFKQVKNQLTRVISSVWNEPTTIKNGGVEGLWADISRNIFHRYRECLLAVIEDAATSLVWTFISLQSK